MGGKTRPRQGVDDHRSRQTYRSRRRCMQRWWLGTILRRRAASKLSHAFAFKGQPMKNRFMKSLVVVATFAMFGMIVHAPVVRAADKVIFTSAINVPFAPSIIAVEKGFAKNHGLDAEYKIFDSGAASVEA